jgi:hypothetical protein
MLPTEYMVTANLTIITLFPDVYAVIPLFQDRICLSYGQRNQYVCKLIYSYSFILFVIPGKHFAVHCHTLLFLTICYWSPATVFLSASA